MNPKTLIRLCALFVIFLFSCKREIEPVNNSKEKSSAITQRAAVYPGGDEDTVYSPTVLGVHLPNPYAIPNIKQV